jgi:hypothetical protein
MFSSFGGIGHRDDEEQYRNLIRKQNQEWIASQKSLGFDIAENQFTHLTLKEWKDLYLTLSIPDIVQDFKIDFRA